MQYLAHHLPLKEDPLQAFPGFYSAIVVARTYLNHPYAQEGALANTAVRAAAYSRGRDYHLSFIEEQKKAIEILKRTYPEHFFLPATDSKPILERDLGARANLGWIGKNSLLIHPKKGSFFWIGEILTSLQLRNVAVTTTPGLNDHCGKCRACIDVCPTQAISEHRTLDARLCISYLTIESRAIPPKHLREKIGDWFFGCDLCQNICPWNQKIYKNQLQIEPQLELSSEARAKLITELDFFLKSSGKSIEKKYRNSAWLRAGPFGLRRNSLIVIGNQKLHELTPSVHLWAEDSRLGELAQWTLEKLKEQL